MIASGVCHSDLHVVDGEWRRPAEVVLGHEGAGIVEELGPGVIARPIDAPLEAGGLRVGDLVTLAWTAPCTACPACLRGEAWLCAAPRGSGHRLDPASVRLHRPDGSGLGVYSGIGTFCSGQVVAAEAAVPIDPRTPPGVAALIGCAATTGVGAVRNTAGVRAGESVVVIGLGGVGLAALMAAVDAGAAPIIAVDLEPAKLEQARSLGATVTATPDEVMTVASGMSSGGPDHVLECIGLTDTVELSPARGPARRHGHARGHDRHGRIGRHRRLSLRGGRQAAARLQLRLLHPGARLPPIAADAVAGRLPLERLISGSIRLEDIEDAFAAMRRRDGARRVVSFAD